VRIGTVELGKLPRVIVALDGQEIKKKLEKARELKIDLIEARIDLIEDRSPASVKAFLDTIADYGFFAVATVRPKWEGGKFRGSEEERLTIFRSIISHPAIGAVDVELRSKLLPKVKELVKRERKVLIVSYHDFESTPDEKEIETILQKAIDAEADIIKVAFMGKNREDAARVCCTVRKLNRPSVFMVMGEFGKFTRVIGFSFGSLLTYTFFGKAVAPGQIEAEELVRLLSEFYPEYRKEKGKFIV